jgi:hypothetical protein
VTRSTVRTWTEHRFIRTGGLSSPLWQRVKVFCRETAQAGVTVTETFQTLASAIERPPATPEHTPMAAVRRFVLGTLNRGKLPMVPKWLPSETPESIRSEQWARSWVGVAPDGVWFACSALDAANALRKRPMGSLPWDLVAPEPKEDLGPLVDMILAYVSALRATTRGRIELAVNERFEDLTAGSISCAALAREIGATPRSVQRAYTRLLRRIYTSECGLRVAEALTQ